LIDSGLVDYGRGAARAEDAQGTLTQSHISPSILVYEDKVFAQRLDLEDVSISVSICRSLNDSLSHTHARSPSTMWVTRLDLEDVYIYICVYIYVICIYI